MSRILFCLSGLVLAMITTLAALPAHAQPRGGNTGQTIVCSSNDNHRRQCATPFRGRAALVENISGTRCVQGRNWGSGDGYVWVDDGCRGRFGSAWHNGGWNGEQGRKVRCESTDNRHRECQTGWRSAVLVRQLSDTRCVEGRTWGNRNGSVWVDDGCRGEFAEGRSHGGGDWGHGRPDNNYSVTCSSDDRHRRNCSWDARQGRPFVLQQLSGTRCEEGRTWGWRGSQIWVDDGCRARFGAR